MPSGLMPRFGRPLKFRSAAPEPIVLQPQWTRRLKTRWPPYNGGSVAAGFCKTCVIDGLLEHSPAQHVRRPSVPAESPTLGFTHLQFEALLTAARESSNPCDFALIAMLGLLGLRIFEATGADIADLANIACSSVVAGPLSTTSVDRVPVSATTSSLASRVRAGRRDLTRSHTGTGPHRPHRRGNEPVTEGPGRRPACARVPFIRPRTGPGSRQSPGPLSTVRGKPAGRRRGRLAAGLGRLLNDAGHGAGVGDHG